MDHTARERGLTGVTRPGARTHDDSNAYEQACDLINQLCCREGVHVVWP
ncbi:hypothetical protein [Streptomyces sp. NBC_00201]|nr:hypothetical protein [Streptomyces sp. NBC_00201]